MKNAIRIGQGYDAHRFGPGDHVMLGGVMIPHDRGVIAHSDGDVLIHALCDALLGAAGLGDIGQHFPDNQAHWQGAAGAMLLEIVIQTLIDHELSVVNADLTLIAQAPRIGPYRDQIRAQIAKLLLVDATCVNIKATTTERMGWIGRAEGLAAQAVVLITTES